MAQITLNATAAQSQRIQETVTAYNAATDQALTTKQWIYMILKQAVLANNAHMANQAAQAARVAALAAIDTDMSGGT